MSPPPINFESKNEYTSWGCDPTSSLFLISVRRVSPRFSIPPSNHEVMPGGSVNLTCVAVGSPMPYVKWIVGDVELTKEDDMPMGRNVLELINITQSANYTCEAMSSLGVIHATAQITVKGKKFQIMSKEIMIDIYSCSCLFLVFIQILHSYFFLRETGQIMLYI